MKKLISILFLLALNFSLGAQTVEQYTMFNLNHYLINPAAAGNQDHLDVALGYRKQWAGVKNSPQNIYATGHTVLNRTKTVQNSAIRTSGTKIRMVENQGKFSGLNKVKHGIGAKINASEFGAFTKTEALLTYAFHLPVYNDVYLSFGLSAGMANFGFDQSKAAVLVDNDPIYNSYVAGQNTNQLNVNSGFYLYSDKFFFGYAAHQLLQNELKLADLKTTSEESNLKIHHFIMGGYNFDLTNDLRITPSVVIKKINPNPISIDMNLTVSYQQGIFIGAAYRNGDAISGIFGYQINHYLKAGYSFDVTTSNLSERANGSHEIFIGLTLF